MRTPSKHTRLYQLLTPILVVMFLFGSFIGVQPAQAAANLTVRIIAAPNLIVDSNVLSPSTRQPIVATVIGEFCNTSGTALENVSGYIGNGTTPGTYPVNANPVIGPAGTQTSYVGNYSFTHLGGAADATRYIGTIPGNTCVYQYWSFTYPKYASTTTPGANNIPAWGTSVKPDDDLWLEFQIWGNYPGQSPTTTTHRMTLRNEISAMANKIQPNGNPGGVWFNTDTSTIYPGETVTTNGIMYRLGNVNQGFDNDGNGMPDYNAWLQPFGDPSYDPSCFRLVSTTGNLYVTTNTGDVTIPFDDNLYFTNLPENNTNVVGVVYYTFLALGGACTIPITPYQEAASGNDNEKFNGDYGAGPAPAGSYEPEVSVVKSGPNSIATSTLFNYTVNFSNNSTAATAGMTISTGSPVDMPLLVEDFIPSGLQFACSASMSFNYQVSGATPLYTIYYTTNSGTSWSAMPGSCAAVTSTAPNSLVGLRFVLNQPMPVNSGTPPTATATFQATSPAAATIVNNCADGKFGYSGTAFDEDCHVTVVLGDNTIGNFVWRDLDRDGVQDGGSETGIDGVAVSLYYDQGTIGTLDDADVLIATQDTAAGGAYSFTQMPDARFLVIVDTADPEIPTGYIPTTATTFAVDATTGGPDYNNNDFGFGPILGFDKQIISATPSYEGQFVTYHVDVTNYRTGDGNPPGYCQYYVWGTSATTGASGAAWTNPTYIAGVPDGLYASAPFKGVSEWIRNSTFNLGQTLTGITRVEVVFPQLVVPSLAGTLNVIVYDTGTSTADTHAVVAETLSSGTFVIDVTADRTWLGSDFTGSSATTYIELEARKSGNPTGILQVDALGYRVTTSTICGNPSNTIDPLPLTDTYNYSRLQFVSSNPPADSVNETTGTITWNNVGPLYGGQTKEIILQFRALEPPTDGDADPSPDPVSVTDINCASTSSGRFTDGAPVNSASDCVTHSINPAGTIGDFVWYDADGDGVQDGGELGIAGVTVRLYDCGVDNTCSTGSGGDVLVANTTTSVTGFYQFTGVQDIGRNYQVFIDADTLPGGAANWTRTNASPTDPATNLTIDYDDASTTNDDINTADLGYDSARPMVVGSVWHDRDNGGVTGNETTPDTGEPGLGSVTVYLWWEIQSGGSNWNACDDPPTAGTTNDDCVIGTTDASGNFALQFPDLTAEVYRNFEVRVSTTYGTGNPLATGTWSQTFDSAGGNNGRDTAHIVLLTATEPAGSASYRGDFSYIQTGSLAIGDLIYADWDGDATQDSGEEGIDGVTVRLYADDGDGVLEIGTDYLQASTATAGGGAYSFTNLPPGDYLVVVDETTLPAGYVQTKDPSVGQTGVCTACDGRSFLDNLAATNNDQDFAYQPRGTASIGDYVWRDDDFDARQDITEVGLPNITVNLYEDGNNNGVIDAGTDALIATVSSDADGLYLFENLIAGNYLVDVDETDAQLPNDAAGRRYVLSTDDGSSTNGGDNDPLDVTLTAGLAYTTADFGFTAPGIIGDFVWQDNDGDGLADSNEPGINGVTMNLYRDVDNSGTLNAGDTLYGSTDTANNSLGQPGYYYFVGVPAGNYIVQVNPAETASGGTLFGYTLSADPDVYNTTTPTSVSCLTAGAQGCDGVLAFDRYASGSTYDETPAIRVGSSETTADFGYRPAVALGDTVWMDLDRDGAVDPGEPGIPFITIWLCTTSPCNGSTVGRVTTATDENGNYSFGNLTSGTTYYVSIDGADTDFPFPIANLTLVSGTAQQTRTPTGIDLTVDFGYDFNGTRSIGGTVFYDAGNNGSPYTTPPDTGYENIRVYLYNDTTGELVGSTTTNAAGGYTFDNLFDAVPYRIIVNNNAPQLTSSTMTYEPGVTGLGNFNQFCDPGEACNNRHVVTLGGANSTGNDFGFYSAAMDCGDMPNTYATSLASTGPCHIIGSLYMGVAPDGETSGVPSVGALSDNTPDEAADYRNYLTQWQNGQSVQLTVPIVGSGGYLVGWFDWNNDGQFSGSYETVIFGNVSSGSNTLSLTVPPSGVYTVGTDIYVRLRLFSGQPLSLAPTGIVTNGEVEDYRWHFGPTAVELSEIQARPAMPPLWLMAAAALLLTASLGSVAALAYARRKR